MCKQSDCFNSAARLYLELWNIQGKKRRHLTLVWPASWVHRYLAALRAFAWIQHLQNRWKAHFGRPKKVFRKLFPISLSLFPNLPPLRTLSLCCKTFSSLNYLLLNFLASQILEHQHTNFFIKIDFQIKKAALSFAEIEPSGSRWTRGFFGFQFPKEHTTEMFRIFIGISSGSICRNLPNSRVLWYTQRTEEYNTQQPQCISVYARLPASRLKNCQKNLHIQNQLQKGRFWTIRQILLSSRALLSRDPSPKPGTETRRWGFVC